MCSLLRILFLKYQGINVNISKINNFTATPCSGNTQVRMLILWPSTASWVSPRCQKSHLFCSQLPKSLVSLLAIAVICFCCGFFCFFGVFFGQNWNWDKFKIWALQLESSCCIESSTNCCNDFISSFINMYVHWGLHFYYLNFTCC